ncbi:BrnT family toxin [Pararhodospirillum oryzae]|uniref:Membrane protein n=1 Tax=Pararhodospirillum oryzae TaxID=478448 RepID=A0A512H3N6_9PROT|nr:BrnT family toxin [Pararhodospirillum oryzae]GEO80079.1 membrane protein [Pararhodospirillum oryzae]
MLPFEWDPQKNEINTSKHFIDFNDAKTIFFNFYINSTSKKESSEPRWIAVGDINGIIIAVVYTYRGEKIRIISARKARTDEKTRYFAERDAASRDGKDRLGPAGGDDG